MHSKKVIESLIKEGWYLRGIKGSHHILSTLQKLVTWLCRILKRIWDLA